MNEVWHARNGIVARIVGWPGGISLINNLRVPVSPCGLYSPRTWQFSRDPA